MSKELLKVALQQPEKIASPLARSLLSDLESKVVNVGPFRILGQIQPDIAQLITGGEAGIDAALDDLIRHYRRKKTAYAKKRAAMIKEAPYQKEYPLTKKAELSRAAKKNLTARNIALAAALFPWSLAIAGGAYLLNKGNSDS